MKSFQVKPLSSLQGELSLPGDKSIAHRCLILSAIAKGKTIIENFPASLDCLYTLKVFKQLGIKIKKEKDRLNKINVFGKGLKGLNKPKGEIFLGNSGTTLRLLLGVLAGQNFRVKLTAGKSLANRPMRRVTVPLRMMGANISAKRESRQNVKQIEEYPPLTVKGGELRPIIYKMPVPSAQVKSAILLAGLYAKGSTRIIEPVKTRDHTERMLKLFKADLKVKQNQIVIKGDKELVSPKKIFVPGDISSASFFIVMATILPNSRILVKNVSLNPSRTGIIRVLKHMGVNIQIRPHTLSKVRREIRNWEPLGDIIVESSRLKGTQVKREEIPTLIDELPILMVAASLAKGKTIFEGVNELRVKETDRIRSMSQNLQKMCADIKVVKVGNSENIIIKGVKALMGTKVRSFGDHRTAMSMVVAGLVAENKTIIDDVSCIDKSFPEFLNLLKLLIS